MKKFVLIIFLLAFLFCPSFLFAQEKSSTQYYQDLLTNYRVYQSLIEPFNTAKSRHQTYKSVSTQAELLKASQDLVSSEIDSILSYTLFTKTLLAEATKVINYHENYLYIKLDDETAFLNTLRNRIGKLTSLGEVDLLTKDLSAHYQIIGQIGYQIKAIIQLGSVNKVFDNVKIDKDKIDKYLFETNFEESKLLSLNAAKEKFSNTSKEVAKVEELLSKATETQKTEVHNDQKGISEQISKLSSEAIIKIGEIIDGYKNIVFSLK